jgi:photosystem II stability/assembly factor-like uncharacterized protein
MKKTKLFFAALLMLVWIMPLRAQQNNDVAKTAEPPNFFKIRQEKLDSWNGVEPTKRVGFKAFNRWENFWSTRVLPDGSFPSPDHNEKEWAKYQREHPASNSDSGNPANWTNLGPNSSAGGFAGVGRIDCIAFHPTNPDIIWVGSPSGGLWKSTNGGTLWVPVTDNYVSALALGIASIAIDPKVPETMYIATGDKNTSIPIPTSNGILKSTDGGNTWKPTGPIPASTIYEVLVNPTTNSRILAATSNGIYLSEDGGDQWTLKKTGQNFFDIKFKPNSSSRVYAVNQNQLFVSDNGGNLWTPVGSAIEESGRIQIAVTPADPSFIALVSSHLNGSLRGFYTSTNSGLTLNQQPIKHVNPSVGAINILNWDLLGKPGTPPGPGQGLYDLCITISPTDPKEIYIGGIILWKSKDGGKTWEAATFWNDGDNKGKPVIHADAHCLAWQNNTLFGGNDGGIYKSTDAGNTWTDLSNTLEISQIYRIGVSKSDTKVIAGLQDNSTKLRETNGTWKEADLSGDGMEAFIHPNNSNILYCSRAFGDLRRFNGVSWSFANPPLGGKGSWITPWTIDPITPSTLYAGYKEVWRSTNDGVNWTKISALNLASPLTSLVVAPSNVKTIYAATKTSIWRTTTGGGNQFSSWSNITTGLPNNGKISYIAVDPSDPKVIYVTLSGLDSGKKVYKSADGGANWTNISGTLPNVSANCITVQPGGNNALYVGTDLGVFYRDGTTTDWISFNTGLPIIIVNELECKTATQKIIAGTWGRGLWESDYYSVGQPANLTVTPTSQAVSSGIGNVPFNVTSNVNWTAVSNAPWLTCSPTSGSGIGTFLANFEENTGPDARTGTITVAGPGGVPAATATVVQAGALMNTCNTPTGLSASNFTATSAILTWTAVSGAQSYSLQYRNLPGGAWSTPITVPGVTHTLNGLQAKTSYEWRVSTNCSNGLMSSNSVPGTFSTTSSSGCNSPGELTTSNITQNTATVNWAPVIGALQYFVIYRKIPNGGWIYTSPTTSTSKSISGLQPDNSYEWRVQTQCTNGFPSAWTTGVTFNTQLPSACNPPGNLQVLNFTHNTASLNWSAVPGALSYTVQFFETDTWKDIVTVNAVTYERYGLWANTSYQWRVITNCSNGVKSVPSAVHTFSTLSAPNCQIGTKWPSNNLTPTSAWKYVQDIYGGEYSVFNVTAGTTYTFSFCANHNGVLNFDGEIFLRLSNGQVISYRNNDCGNKPKLVWQSNFTGLVQVLLTKHECQAETTSSTMAYVIGNFFTDDDPEERSEAGSETEEPNRSALVVFPNPSSGNFTVQFDPGQENSGSASIRVFNPLGYAVWERSGVFPEGLNTFEVAADQWPNGMYLVQMLNDQGVQFTQKIYLMK